MSQIVLSLECKAIAYPLQCTGTTYTNTKITQLKVGLATWHQSISKVVMAHLYNSN